jgi:hypothetical protein
VGHLLWETSARVSLLGEAELVDTPLTLPSLGLLDIIGSMPAATPGARPRDGSPP